MRSLFLCLFQAIAFITISVAQTDTQTAPSYAPTIDENALLWKIEGKELSTPSYLYGTIHMIGSEDYFLTDETEEAFDVCERVTFEINLEDMMDFGSQMSLMMDAFMKDGVTLKDLLSDEDYKVVDEHFKEMGMPLFLLERIKPMFLSIFASGDMDMFEGGFGGMGGDSTASSIVSYEMEFMEMAKKAEKEMAGLETAEYQMSVFDSIPYKDQAVMLVESIKAEDTTDDGQFDMMVEMYKKQDIRAMQKMIASEESGGMADFEDVLLHNRNRNWIPVMAEQMNDKPTFFAVGAGHLGGPIGVVALLREEGYTLTAINPVK